MRTFFLFLLTVFLSSNVEASLNNSHFALKRYYSPQSGPYIELQMLLPANGLVYALNSNGKLQAAAEILITIEENGNIFLAEKYLLQSVEYDTNTAAFFSLLDQKRFMLENGNYHLNLSITDAWLEDAEPVTFKFPFEVGFRKNQVSMSDISLIEYLEKTEEENTFVKNGFYLAPLVMNYVPDALSKLSFYTEIYNAESVLEGKPFLVTYSIKKHKSEEVVAGFNAFKKMDSKMVTPLMAEFNIQNLPSGNYDLSVSVRDQLNKVLVEQTFFFQRAKTDAVESFEDLLNVDVSNTLFSEFNNKECIYWLKSLVPITEGKAEGGLLRSLRSKDTELMRKYLYNHFVNIRPLDPAGAFAAHKALVMEVNRMFSTPALEGFETDRGRVFMVYGPPDDVNRSGMEPGGKPYEIWEYFQLKDNQTRARFIFCNTTLEANFYELIHSTARGEIYNPQWKNIIYKFRNMDGVDDERMRPHHGSRVDEFLERY